jgi:hypothetical protein
MKNWKDYVGDVVELDDVVDIKDQSYLIATAKGVFFDKFVVEDLSDPQTEDTIGDLVEEAFLSFPAIQLTSNYNLQDAKIDVACNTYRSLANVNWNNVWLYQDGVSEEDQALFVFRVEESYYIAKHPNFSKYGFVIS